MKMPVYVYLAAASLFLGGCGNNSSKTAQTTNSTSSGNPLTAPVDYLGALGNAQKLAVKTVDVASLNQAIQMFNVQEGRFPKDLHELLESKLIDKLPDAPYGMKLEYDANTGKVTVVKQ